MTVKTVSTVLTIRITYLEIQVPAVEIVQEMQAIQVHHLLKFR